ncbi:MAG: IclR family transcriptional regulator [Acidobacteria bacterium]|nr:IclR family transcriptional regulator [Acidobacteriota bacterium]
MGNARKNAQKYYVPALEKGLDIIEALAASSAPQSLSEMARNLGRTSSELFRILNALERRGYVERDPASSKYSLTLRLYELAHTHSPVEKLLGAVTIPMRSLAQRLKESCHVSTLENGRLIVLAQADSPDSYRFSVEVGAVFSPFRTASGRLLLSYLKEEEFQHFCATSAGYRKLSGAARSKLLGELDEIRRKGVSTARNEPVLGVESYAVLVGNPAIEFTAALAVASLDIRGKESNPREIVASLKKTAAEINRAIGLRQ